MKTARTYTLPFLNSRVLIGFALYAAGLVLVFAPLSGTAGGDNTAAELSQSLPSARSRQVEESTGDLGVPHGGHTATLLQNGQVLVAGGDLHRRGRRTIRSGDWGVDGDSQSWLRALRVHTATLLPECACACLRRRVLAARSSARATLQVGAKSARNSIARPVGQGVSSSVGSGRSPL